MLLSAVYVLVVVQLSSEIPEGLMNNPVYSNWNLIILHMFTVYKLIPVLKILKVTKCHPQVFHSYAV